MQISVTARRDCEVSGVAVAPVPLSNYAFDTNISSGLDASFGDDIDTIVQELLLTPVWTALVWLIHVAVVALEWCYSIDLLAPSTLGPVSAALSGAERIFTTPWLGLALALASIAFVWHGVVRRRVTETLGQAALMAVMMSVGLWIIADPAGTVGALAQLADEAALGTVAVTAAGSPGQPVASLDDALGEVFDTAITGPWCYLEFGDVDWCRDPSQLDPRLEATGQRLQRHMPRWGSRPSAMCSRRQRRAKGVHGNRARAFGSANQRWPFPCTPGEWSCTQRAGGRNGTSVALPDPLWRKRRNELQRRDRAAG